MAGDAVFVISYFLLSLHQHGGRASLCSG